MSDNRSEDERREEQRRKVNAYTDNKLINELELLKNEFSSTADKLIKDVKRQDKIMARSDKRQKQEYDQLQTKLEEVNALQVAQKDLLDSFIKLIAGAIDAKSKYTGGHCSRVPELSLALIHEVSNSKEEVFKDFEITTDDELREIDIASWLHDCGKVTTPEYVVDKATKLETIYNRIHEIRTRFEVIHRDLTIESLNKIISGENKKEVELWLQNEHEKLRDEFTLVATANIGGEFMGDDKQEEITNISKRTWNRYFDDTIGISADERKRLAKNKDDTLPFEEKLLDDKKQHIFIRDHFNHKEYEEMGFKMDVPEDLYNLGEVYNLNISRGTLTNEERFKINEHVVMTIKMLEEINFPEYLKNVPLYAGAHHETLIGTGYPRRLTKEEMPIPSRVMAIADVFEALTASDRHIKSLKHYLHLLKYLALW